LATPHAPNLSYARGDILRSAEDDFRKLEVAWSLIPERGVESIDMFTGLEHRLPLAPKSFNSLMTSSRRRKSHWSGRSEG
jgi:hypothetical protein